MHGHRKSHMLCGQTSSLSAQKHPHVTSFRGGKKCLLHFFPEGLWFHVFAVVLLITENCHKSLENHGWNNNHTFFIFTSTKVVWNNCFNAPTSSTYPHLQRIHIFNVSTSSTYQHLQLINIFNITTSSPTHPSLYNLVFSTSTHLPWMPYAYKLDLHVKTEGSWKLRGTPSLDPIYIYIFMYMNINIYIYIIQMYKYTRI